VSEPPASRHSLSSSTSGSGSNHRDRVDYDDVQLTFDVDKGAADAMDEVEEPESQPAHV
jgi:hypothetical protein